MTARAGHAEPCRPKASAGDDRSLADAFDAAARAATEALENHDFRAYALGVRHFTRDVFCSRHLEAAKPRLADGDTAAAETLMWCLDGILRLSHPLAPFVTERIRMACSPVPLVTDTWPT